MLKNSLCIQLSLFNTRIFFHLVGHLPWKWNCHWSESCSVVSDLLWSHGLYSPWNSPGQNTGVGSLCLLQWIVPTQGSNSGLPHCRWILYQLSHRGSPRILEWIAYPFSSGSSPLRNWTGVSCIAGEFFTNWAIREALGHGQLLSSKCPGINLSIMILHSAAAFWC